MSVGEGSERRGGNLGTLKAQAAQNVERLRAELAALRDMQPERDVHSATEHLALQQEVETLRLTLHEKDRVVDLTEAQCRRLEDELEDQHLTSDGLKQDLERQKLALAAAREEVARLTEERQLMQERFQVLIEQRGASAGSEAELDLGLRPPRRKSLPASLADIRFLGGLALGALLAVGGVLLLGQQVWTLPAGSGPPPADAAVAGSEDGVSPETFVPPAAEEAGSETHPSSAEEVSPVVAGTLTDRLSGGGFGPPMVVLEDGTFTMGQVRTLPNDDWGPVHEVNVAGFLIGANEVTFAEYDRFARATGRRLPNDYGWGRGRRPVVDVSWQDATAYAEWLSGQTRARYRLPSEAEWEYAASAGRRSAYWWGFEPGQGRAVCFDCGSDWDKISTAPVGSFESNPIGLYDTHGNAMEWVQDCYQPDYEGAPTDGRPRQVSGCRYRVARGGAFNKPAHSMRSTARNHFTADTRLNTLGFRLARDR